MSLIAMPNKSPDLTAGVLGGCESVTLSGVVFIAAVGQLLRLGGFRADFMEPSPFIFIEASDFSTKQKAVEKFQASVVKHNGFAAFDSHWLADSLVQPDFIGSFFHSFVSIDHPPNKSPEPTVVGAFFLFLWIS